jgi:hypothetical protein
MGWRARAAIFARLESDRNFAVNTLVFRPCVESKFLLWRSLSVAQRFCGGRKIFCGKRY